MRRGGRAGIGALAISGMVLEDIPAVMEVENRSFPTPWSASSFRHELLENPYASLFVARIPDPPGIIAFACVWVVDEEMKINNLAVHPLWRSRGVATRLLEFLLDFALGQGCREVTLEVRPSNAVALRLYQRTGFAVVGRRKRYYTDTHEDALVMARSVHPRKTGS
ncbi:MAG TPA: ribosomal protein S18-alanine N-acetyltransferase [Candidatus Polarisedimenticolia bacterium]|nr:ribosomal protein S18-alanine N-acetyltransferase [Candidatus Polarisedimenticolia bacterium]